MIAPVTLHGATVTLLSLLPLTPDHAGPLADIGLEPALWALQPRRIGTVADMRAYVDAALDEQARGAGLPFVVARRGDGQLLGSTRFMDIAPAHRRLEIGATWYAPQFQRSGANLEAKLLMLTHAFEALGMRKVVLKTETLNMQSRAAILALGAQQEGIFRRHLIADGGRPRDMVYFAILDEEWPAVRARLVARLQR